MHVKNPHSLQELKISIEREIAEDKLQHMCQEIFSESVRLDRRHFETFL